VLNRSQQQQTGTYQDYAMVARLMDPNADQFVVIAAEYFLVDQIE